MSVKILIGSSHSKFIYKEATKEEIKKSESILNKEFSFKDKSLERDWRVKKGLMKPEVSFYIKEKNILSTGFIPFYFKYAKDENIDLEVIDTRRFPIHDEDFLNQEHIVINGKTARDYQIDILKAIVKYKNGIIDSPPGTGKTLTMAMFMKLFPKAKILILLDRITLIHQAYKEFTENFGFSPKEVGIIQGKNVDYEDKRIIFLNIDSYHKAFDLYPDIDIICSDETHATSTNDTAEKIFFSCQKASIRIGFTGSPEADNEYTTARMIAMQGPIIYTAPVKEKIAKGYLSHVDIHIHVPKFEHIPSLGIWQDVYDLVEISQDQIEEYENQGTEVVYHYNKPHIKELSMRGDEYNIFINNDERNEFLANLSKDRNRVLYLFSKIQHGQNLYNKIIKFKPHAKFLSGINTQKDREEAIEYLNKEEDSVVVASSIFTTGVNIVNLKHVILCGGFKESRQIIQSLGRVTRRIVGIKEKGYVHDIDDSSINSIAGRQYRHRLGVYKNTLELPIKFFNYN